MTADHAFITGRSASTNPSAARRARRPASSADDTWRERGGDALRYIPPMSLFDVAGKSILITGATGALGSVAARALSEAGALLTLAGGNSAGLTELVESTGISDAALVNRRPETPDDAAAMVDAALAKHGRLDGVLVASGMNKPGRSSTWRSRTSTPSWTPTCGCVARVPGSGQGSAATGRRGSVVLVSSVCGTLGFPTAVTPCPLRIQGGDRSADQPLAAEWGHQQIRVNALAPTVFRSELTA